MDVNSLDVNALDEPVDLATNVTNLERKMMGMASHLTKVTSALETMADNLALSNSINLRGRPYQDRPNTTAHHSTLPHNSYYSPRQNSPADYYIQETFDSPCEPPLTATPNTGFYGFTPNRQRRGQPAAKYVSFCRTPESAPICAYCHKIGPLAKDCGARRQGRSRNNTQGNPGRRQQQGRPTQGGR